MAVRVEGNLPAYSVLNKSAQGFSVYMETLQALGVETRQSTAAVEEEPVGAVQILAYRWRMDAADPQWIRWVRDGGVLVLALPEPLMTVNDGDLLSESNGVRTWQVGKGRIVVLPATALTNRTLTKNTIPSRTLTAELIALGHRPVLFNEQALFPGTANPSLWKAAPLWLKLLVYQLLLAATAWFWMKGDRLGKPLPLTAETERTELEYLYAAAHFYQAAGCWRLMLTTYYSSLIRLLGAREDNWIEHWSREELPDITTARALKNWMENVPSTCTAKEIQRQIVVIEQLKEIIKNRRHDPWQRAKQQ